MTSEVTVKKMYRKPSPKNVAQYLTELNPKATVESVVIITAGGYRVVNDLRRKRKKKS